MGGHISRDDPCILAFENFDFPQLLSDVEWPFYFRRLNNIIQRLCNACKMLNISAVVAQQTC